jgi:hypothetical protein
MSTFIRAGAVMKRNLISSDDVKKISSGLKTLPELEKKVTFREAISLLREDIDSLRKKGYSWDKIVDALGKEGFTISKLTLCKHLRALDTDAMSEQVGIKQKVNSNRTHNKHTKSNLSLSIKGRQSENTLNNDVDSDKQHNDDISSPRLLSDDPDVDIMKL